ncbi:MAG: hypothetical protein ABSE49_13945 [Polyangiaceae bacterium]|jgi:hypothetical protein
MRWGSRERVASAVLAASLALPGAARAQPWRPEPTYGRFQGDVTLVAGLGGVVAARGGRAEAELRVRYLESVGVFATYEDGALVGSAAEPTRVLSTGLELRPLFLFRWLTGREAQRARFDLAVDSLGLELGATFAQPAGTSFGSRAGLQAGLGVEVPLLTRATGPWLGFHAGVRWSDEALATGVVANADDRSGYVAISLAWHQLVVTHVVDEGDEAPR